MIIAAPPLVAPPPLPPPPLVDLINVDAGDEPYSPGGSPEDLDLLSLRLPLSSKASGSATVMPKSSEDLELARKVDELNRQIAAQEMEIAGLITRETAVNVSLLIRSHQITFYMCLFVLSPTLLTNYSCPPLMLSNCSRIFLWPLPMCWQIFPYHRIYRKSWPVLRLSQWLLCQVCLSLYWRREGPPPATSCHHRWV